MLTRLCWTVLLSSRATVKVPPRTIFEPTLAMAYTRPSRTCGVSSTGLAETTTPWGEFTAAAGGARVDATAQLNNAHATTILRNIVLPPAPPRTPTPHTVTDTLREVKS